MIKKNDRIKWKTSNIGYARGVILDIDKDTVKVSKYNNLHSFGRGFSKPSTYTIKKVGS